MKRVLYLDVLKVAAIYFMICLHVSGLAVLTLEVSTPEWMQGNVIDSACRWCVPVFVMVSGALFLNPEKNVSLKKLWSKTILRLAVAYVFWSCLYAFYNLYAAHLSTGWTPSKMEILQKVALGEEHMWFILMIIMLYVFTPALREVAKNRKVLAYTAVACIVVMLVDAYKGTLWDGSGTFAVIRSRMGLSVGFVGYYLLGRLLATVKGSRLIAAGSAVAFIAGFVLTFTAEACATAEAGKLVETYYSNYMLNVALMSVGMFMFVKCLFEEHETRNVATGRVRALVHKLGSLSLGAYLVHFIFIRLFALDGMAGTFPMAFLWSALIFVLAFAFAWAIRAIPVVGKYLA